MDGNDKPARLPGRGTPPLQELTETVSLPGAAELADLPEGRTTAALWQDQRRRWEAGERPPVEAYVRALTQPVPDDVLLDLIYGEFVLRREQGEEPQVEEYERRFPEQAGAIRRQFWLHEGLTAPPAGLARSTAPAPAEAALGPPAELAGYRIIALLGSGGQGVVYRALHPTLGRDVVVKVGLNAVRPEAVNALLQEGRILAELDHPGLARVYDLRLHEGRPCLVMEYIRGAHLGQYARRQPPAPAAAAALVARVARALGAAHRRGVTHRDVKPHNILIDEAGAPRLIDFGLARVETAWQPPPADEGGLSGTLSYMAPEQARGEAVTPAADVFALGGVLYFLLTGRAPYTGTDSCDVYHKAASAEWDRAALADPRVPARLRAVVEKAMAADPKARFATAEEMAGALEAFARPARRWPWLAGAAAAAVLAAAAALWWHGRPDGTLPSPAPPRPFSLTVRVGPPGGTGYFDLAQGASVATGYQVRAEAVAPAGMHATLFVFNGRALRPLVTVTPPDEDRPIGYPEDPKKAVRLTPPDGNELVLLVARRSGPVAETDLREWLAGSWVTLPPDIVLRLAPEEVKVLGKSRDFGGDVERADPVGEVKGRLEELRKRLRERGDYFEGLMFSHRE